MKKENQISFDRLVAKYFQNSDKATILQDLKHFNQSKIKNNKLRHGLPLVYYSCNEVTATKFEHINERTLRRYLSQLTKDGILFSTVCNRKNYDKTKSYIVNFAYYDAISNGIEYPITDKEKFTNLCGEIVKNTEIDCKVLKIDNGNEPKTHGQIDQTHGQIDQTHGQIDRTNGQIDRTNGQIDQPIPTNTPSNNSKKSNDFFKLINLKTLKNDKNVLAENTKNTVFSKEQLKAIDGVKSIFKYYRITIHKNCNLDIASLISYLQNELENHSANFSLDRKPTMQNIYDLIENLIIEIWGRIKESETKKQNLKFFDTCIRNEYKTEIIDKYLCNMKN